MQCKQNLVKCLCIRSYLLGGLLCHMEWSHGRELKWVGRQSHTTVRHVSEVVQNRPAPAYLPKIHKCINECTQHHVEQCWNSLRLAQIADQQNWEQINGSCFKPLKITRLPLCLSLFLQARIQTWDWWARLNYVEEDNAWRNLSGQKRSVLSDQDRSNNGWWASHPGPPWLWPVIRLVY